LEHHSKVYEKHGSGCVLSSAITANLSKEQDVLNACKCQKIRNLNYYCIPNWDIIMFNKLQYISQGNTVEEQTRNIHQALDGGCKWIQRFKNHSDATFFAFGEKQKFYAKISEFYQR
jgi:hypothetical protein